MKSAVYTKRLNFLILTKRFSPSTSKCFFFVFVFWKFLNKYLARVAICMKISPNIFKKWKEMIIFTVCVMWHQFVYFQSAQEYHITQSVKIIFKNGENKKRKYLLIFLDPQSKKFGLLWHIWWNFRTYGDPDQMLLKSYEKKTFWGTLW